MIHFLLISSLFVSQHSFAARDFGKTRAEVVEACKGDMEKFCKTLGIGSGLLECMKKHEAELSPACKTARGNAKNDFKAKRKEVRTACRSDAELYCKSIRGPKNRFDCLQKNRQKLSAECQSALPELSKD